MHHVRKQYNRWSFRLSVLGKYVDAGQSYEDEISAGVAADLAKQYLATEFRVDLSPSLDGDLFSSLAYSRLHVDLSSSFSVEKALAPGVKTFINENAALLLAHKNSQPGPTLSSKFRNSGMYADARIKDWVEKLEAAEGEEAAFAALNSEYFFRLLGSLPGRLTDVLKPLRLAYKLHDGVTNSRLVSRRGLLALLIQHIELNLQYVTELTADLRAEQANVEGAVATLELNRPSLS